MARTAAQTRNSRSASFDSFGNPRTRSYSAPYISGSAAPALEPELPRTRTRTAPARAPKIETKQGGKTRVQTKAITLEIPIFVRVFACAVLLFAIIGFVNITFTSAALASATQQEAINAQISEARETGKTLEVELGTLSNPTSIKDKAKALGMGVATETIQINLAEDIVKTDADGNITLAGSLKAAAGV